MNLIKILFLSIDNQTLFVQKSNVLILYNLTEHFVFIPNANEIVKYCQEIIYYNMLSPFRKCIYTRI